MKAPLASPALAELAGAIGQHAGCNLSGAAIIRARSAAFGLYAEQARDILRDLHMPAMEVLRAARMAVHDHVLFDGPHDRPTALLDHTPTQTLFGVVLRVPQAIYADQLAGLRAL